MKFISISNDITINKDEILYIKSEDKGNSCTICIDGEEFPCIIPYKSFLMLIKTNDKDDAFDKLSKYLETATNTVL